MNANPSVVVIACNPSGPAVKTLYEYILDDLAVREPPIGEFCIAELPLHGGGAAQSLARIIESMNSLPDIFILFAHSQCMGTHLDPSRALIENINAIPAGSIVYGVFLHEESGRFRIYLRSARAPQLNFRASQTNPHTLSLIVLN